MGLSLSSHLGASAAFLSSITWAIGVSVYSKLGRRHVAYQIHWSRILVAFPLFVLMIFIQGGVPQILKIHQSNLFWAGVSSVSSFAFGDVLFLWSTVALGAPVALAIASTYPFWSALAGFLFKGETLSTLRALGLFLTVAGSVTVILAGYRHHRKNLPKNLAATMAEKEKKDPHGKILESYPVGLALAFLASMAWAMNTYSGMRANDGVIGPVANAARLGLALFLCPFIGALMTRSRPRLLPKQVFRKYSPIFAIEGFCGSTFFLYGLSHAPLAVASALSSLAPVLAVPLGLVTGAEKFSPSKTLGVAMVVAGIALLV